MLVVLLLACAPDLPAPTAVAEGRPEKREVPVEASVDLHLGVAAPPETVLRRLLDLDRALACTPDKVRARRVDAATIEVTSATSEQGVDFHGTATTRYVRAGNVVTWSTTAGSNPAVRARVEVRATADGQSTVGWTQTSTTTLDVPPAKVVFVRAGAPARIRRAQEAFAACVLAP